MFKAGDEVRVLDRDSLMLSQEGFVGEVFIVERIDRDGDIYVLGQAVHYTRDEVELVEPKVNPRYAPISVIRKVILDVISDPETFAKVALALRDFEHESG